MKERVGNRADQVINPWSLTKSGSAPQRYLLTFLQQVSIGFIHNRYYVSVHWLHKNGHLYGS